ncbi:hypothetical protein ABWI01_07175 [Oceanicaulis alexandrii]|uniref:hypothetical protein n=1 Tax=Oceanicaulis alexandrii TaxID=153233 RepID=UPI0035CF7221
MFSRRPYDLKNLMRGGSTPRVLDLCGLHKRFPDLAQTPNPLFRHRGLNRCFLIKHNLRRNERSLVRSGRNIVTKLVMPIDPKDPGAGAFWTFIEAPNLEAWLEEALGRDRNLYEEEFSEDVRTLSRLKSAPAFDPFLLEALFPERELDPRYFTMAKADEAEFKMFAARHMADISAKALGESTTRKRPERLAAVLFNAKSHAQREDLRNALRMDPEDFTVGVFGWKGLLYYLWRMNIITEELASFLRDLARLEKEDGSAPFRPLAAPISRIRRSIRLRWEDLKAGRENYYRVVSAFLDDGDPIAMRMLLLKAPNLFSRIGDDVAALTHLTTYWNYWRRQRGEGVIRHEMATTLLPDLAGDIARDLDDDMPLYHSRGVA